MEIDCNHTCMPFIFIVIRLTFNYLIEKIYKNVFPPFYHKAWHLYFIVNSAYFVYVFEIHYIHASYQIWFCRKMKVTWIDTLQNYIWKFENLRNKKTMYVSITCFQDNPFRKKMFHIIETCKRYIRFINCQNSLMCTGEMVMINS